MVYANVLDASSQAGRVADGPGAGLPPEGLPVRSSGASSRGSVPAYEVWRYFEPSERWYLFADRGALGGFRLLR
ncbi:MAG: hypothetical protein R2882_05790 [Gemmatimonadales bacterium]